MDFTRVLSSLFVLTAYALIQEKNYCEMQIYSFRSNDSMFLSKYTKYSTY